MMIINPYRFVVAGGGLTFTAKTMFSSTSNVSSFSTSSITPTANTLLLATVANSKATAADLPTLSGCGLTWVQVATVTWDTSSIKRVTLFRALGASPSAGALTADFGGVAQTGCHICVVEWGGVDTSGTNGSGAIVQSATNSGGSSSTSVTATLAALTGSINGVYMSAANRTVPFGGTPDSGWLENQDTSHTSPNHGFSDIYSTATTDNTPSTAISADSFGAIAVEIKKA